MVYRFIFFYRLREYYTACHLLPAIRNMYYKYRNYRIMITVFAYRVHVYLKNIFLNFLRYKNTFYYIT